jgi:septum formation protein
MSLTQPEHLVLASTSPRRAELLQEAGYRFEVSSPPMEEPDEKHPHVDPTLHAESLAYFKARSVAPANFDKTILAADTIAVVDDEIIGKPADRADAQRILGKLSGKSHRVITGVALLYPAIGRRLLTHDVSTVKMRELARKEIDAYLDSGEWQGKAGAYGIQDRGDQFVEETSGSFTNIVGLPMELLSRVFIHWTGTTR